jgi:hypothetical protein
MQTGSFPQFAYDIITDIILTFRYTAWEAGGLLHQQDTVDLQAAVDKITLSQNEQAWPSYSACDMNSPTVVTSSAGDQSLKLQLDPDRSLSDKICHL